MTLFLTPAWCILFTISPHLWPVCMCTLVTSNIGFSPGFHNHNLQLWSVPWPPPQWGFLTTMSKLVLSIPSVPVLCLLWVLCPNLWWLICFLLTPSAPPQHPHCQVAGTQHCPWHKADSQLRWRNASSSLQMKRLWPGEGHSSQIPPFTAPVLRLQWNSRLFPCRLALAPSCSFLFSLTILQIEEA